MNWLAGVHWNLLLWLVGAVGAMVWCVVRARRGQTPHLRRIAGLEAVNDAVGRATEEGRPVMYIAGVMDLDEVQTVASLGILGAVGERVARHGCEFIMPTDRSLVMAASREVLRESYTRAGRPDDFVADSVSYISNDQFGFAARVDGLVARHRPGAVFLQGAFFAESLLMAEAGAQVGAVQVAGTAMNHQLPFLVAACDHVLIGEEFFAAEAYLDRDPERLGNLRGQDLVKDAVLLVLLAGATLVTLADLTGWTWFATLRDALLMVVQP